MFKQLTKTMRNGRKAGKNYRKAIDRSIGLDEARARVQVENVFRSTNR